MNTALAQAVAVFKDLGWADASPDQVMSLPVGTKEQRRIALAGLSSGEWGEIAQIKPGSWGRRSYVDVNEALLALFAVRIGVGAQRAAAVLTLPDTVSDDLATAVLASRGSAFAASFIRAACVSSRRLWTHSATIFGGVAVRLVAGLDLPAPENSEYMKDWAVFAAASLGVAHEPIRPERSLPELALIRDRFADHVRAGIAANTPATGPFGMVVAAGAAKNWIDRAEAQDLVFAALETAIRPGDRKAWVRVLDQLGLADGELVARADALIPLLATGQAFLVERFAPPLINAADDATAVEALTASLAVPTKKALRTVLQAALSRPGSRPRGADDLTGQLTALTTDSDKPVARLAADLAGHWALAAASAPADQPPPIQDLWQATPPVWQVPRFDHGEATPEALTRLAAELTGHHSGVVDITVERFLAVANAAARRDAADAKTALRGLKGDGNSVLYPMADWVADRPSSWFADDPERAYEPRFYGPLMARSFAVCQHLGQLPRLLSEPSYDDLSIDAADLADRLEIYAAAGAPAVEADLFLALTRINPTTVRAAVTARLDRLAVPIVLQSGELMPVTAGPAAVAYLADPVVEPKLKVRQSRFWETKRLKAPASLSRFPDRFGGYYDLTELFAMFPHWGDAALQKVAWSEEVNREQGLILRQVARRAGPLPPGAAINFLAAQRSMHPDAAEDSALAVSEAWERGLLRPGQADVQFLDWTTTPSHLAALATALTEITQTGPLAVVWPVLDDLVAASLRLPRLAAGTAEIVEAVAALLPEAQAALTRGLAPPGTLDLIAVRALAARPGSSRAVTVARQIAAHLTEPAQPAAATAPRQPVTDPAFEMIWPKDAGRVPAIVDGARVTAGWDDPAAPGKLLFLDLTLPDRPGRRYRVMKKDWVYE
ncbi:MAG: hypothetical protein LBU05_07080, partial [Bifidobacteriaceae bacterium]|nr:hypothetical protein [Bifidobacteriaceae bacterium]